MGKGNQKKTFEPKFTDRDLERVMESLKRRIDDAHLWREYALKETKKNTVKRLSYDLFSLLIMTKGQKRDFLQKLNSGTFQFLPGKVFFLTNPYFGKLRLTYKFAESASEQPLKTHYLLNKIAMKLVSLKVKDFLNSLPDSHNLLQPPRAFIIKRLIKSINSTLENDKNKKFFLLRGDFKDYTLNIPRDTATQLLADMGLPENILTLIQNFLQAGNLASASLRRYPIKKFFKEVGYAGDYSVDALLRGLMNEGGIAPGSPISNVLGQIFLLDFDKMMRKIAGGDGFYARFLDDFILIFSSSKSLEEVSSYLENLVSDFMIKKYKNHPAVVSGRQGELIKIETVRELPAEFDFLGYFFIPDSKTKKWRVTIRYKSIKKFLIKYLYEYKPKFTLNTSKEDFLRYLSAKSCYIYRWINSFVEINDKRLLDKLYIEFIYPDLIGLIISYLKLSNRSASNKEIRNRAVNIAKEVKNYFKPTLIHRLLKKGNGKYSKKSETSKEDLIYALVYEARKNIEKLKI